MSLGGRYVIDRIKRSIGQYVRLPVPPYNNPNYWEGVYKKMAEPSAVFEWGDFDCEDVLDYSCRLERYSMKRLLFLASQNDLGQASVTGKHLELTPTSWAEAIGIAPTSTVGDTEATTTRKHKPTNTKEQQQQQQQQQQSILMLGCGNSMFGPDMLEHGWRGPILGVDVSARLIHDLSRRFAQQHPQLRFLQDDATFLSAIEDATVAAVIDKGMVDAVFCTEDYDTCHAVLRSVHRVMVPGGIFCCFSFSRPEFLLQKILLPSGDDAAMAKKRHTIRKSQEQQLLREWSGVEIQRLGFIYLYRFFKVSQNETHLRIAKTKGRSPRQRRTTRH